MERHAVVLRGGPLDGQHYSVVQEQNEILGVGGVDEDDGHYARADSLPLTELVEDRDTVDPDGNELTEDEQVATALARLYPGQAIVNAAVFEWRPHG